MTKCSIRTIAGNRLEIEVNGGNGFNVNMIKNRKNLEILNKVCRDLFGKSMEIALDEKKTSERKTSLKKKPGLII